MKVAFEVDARLVVVTSLTGLAGVFAVHTAYPGLFLFWPSTSQDLAAWVQALGSVAAIVGAVWATKYQIRRAKEAAHMMERQRALQLGLSALHVAARAHRLARNASKAFEDWHRYGSFLANTDTKFDNAIASAEVVLAKNLDAEVLRHLLDVRSCMAIAAGAIDLQRGNDPDARAVAPTDMSKAVVGLAYARWHIRRTVRSVAKEVQRLSQD